MQGMPDSLSVRLLAVAFACGFTSVWTLVHRDTIATVMVGALLIVPFACLLCDRSRVNGFGALFMLTALLGAMGYTPDLFWWVRPYDAYAHAVAAFSVSLAFFVLYRDTVLQRSAFTSMASLLALGMGVGALWETFEWFTGGGYGLRETVHDLLLDGLGTLMAVLVTLASHHRALNTKKHHLFG